MRRITPLGRAALAMGSSLALLCPVSSVHEKSVSAQSGHETESLHAFAVVASVLKRPRCLNCHVSGDAPLQGDLGTPHNMNVKRGPDGRGTPAMHCTNCHQDENSRQLHSPPGRPDWRMPPPDT